MKLEAEMKSYKCHKEVLARPMSRGDYNEYRTWTIPEGENPNDEGYLIIYNAGSEDHYESWSPKKQFDDGYNEIIDLSRFSTIEKYFTYEHLPEHLRDVSKKFAYLVMDISSIVESAEKTAGMRKLLEAKDCFVRAKLRLTSCSS